MNKKKNPRMKQFNIRLTAEELENLRRNAWDQNMSISAIVTQVLAGNGLLVSPTVKNNS